jgi:hypothetical protein
LLLSGLLLPAVPILMCPGKLGIGPKVTKSQH